MHQTANAREILKAAESLARESRLARIHAIYLHVAAWADIDTDELREDVRHAALGTIAEGAKLEIEVVEPRGRCADCGAEFTPDGAALRCRACGGARVRMEQVEEVKVHSVA